MNDPEKRYPPNGWLLLAFITIPWLVIAFALWLFFTLKG